MNRLIIWAFVLTFGGHCVSSQSIESRAGNGGPERSERETPRPPPPPPEPEPDWRISADWCASKDDGSSHHAWHRTCQNADQYRSILTCQSDAKNGRARAQIEAAGQTQVNA